jgi:heme exporter protein A
MSILKVDNLVAYRRGPIFKPASFSLVSGEVLRLTGTNGAGKTTLLECLVGGYRNYSGRIERRGTSVSYLPQLDACVHSLSLVECAVMTVGFDKSKYGVLVSSLALSGSQNKPLALLSGGERQRARLVLALLRRHTLLVLDEPFANVDGESKRIGLSLILKASHGSSATIIVEHTEQLGSDLPKRLQTYELRSAHHDE